MTIFIRPFINHMNVASNMEVDDDWLYMTMMTMAHH